MSNIPQAELSNVNVTKPIPYDLEGEIERLKREKNAVVLAHYYQEDDIQDIADFIGDSLDLSRKAAATDADMIVFCGVKFMAEVAKIVSPEKKGLLPDMAAGCSLETSCPADQFKKFREAHPDHLSLTYINCSAEVKALGWNLAEESVLEKFWRCLFQTFLLETASAIAMAFLADLTLAPTAQVRLAQARNSLEAVA